MLWVDNFQGVFLSFLRGIKQISCLWNRETTYTPLHEGALLPCPKMLSQNLLRVMFSHCFPTSDQTVNPGNSVELILCPVATSTAHPPSQDSAGSVCGLCENGHILMLPVGVETRTDWK